MPRTSSGYSLLVGAQVDTSKLKSQLDRFGNTYKLQIQAVVNGSERLDRLNSDLRVATTSVQHLETATREATSTMRNFTSKATSGLQQVNREATNVGHGLSKVFIDQARTRLVTLAINQMIQGFQDVVQVVKEFDDALTEMKKVSDLSGDALDRYTVKLGELGQLVARTRTEMVESSTSFIKSGYTEEEAARLAQISELYRNIADEELSSAESANFIISQMKAFQDETDEFAMHTIDAINNVSNNMAVSSANIATALSKTSSAMATLGNSYEETLGLVTAGSEIMQGQSSKVARGLRTIGNNIANLAQQQSTLAIETKNGTKQIELFDEATGDMKNTTDVIRGIAESWDDMTNAQRQAVGIALAGGQIGLASNRLKYGKDGVVTVTVLYNYNMVA